MEHYEEDYLSEEEEVDFIQLNENIQYNIDRLWENIFVRYLKSESCILNMSQDDIKLFIKFFYKNSKYYNFVLKNLN